MALFALRLSPSRISFASVLADQRKVLSCLPCLTLRSKESNSAWPLCSTRVTRLHDYYGPLRHPVCLRPFSRVSVTGTIFSRDFSLGHTGLLQFPSCPCCRVAANTPPVCNIAPASLRCSILSSPRIDWLDHRSLGIYEACSAFTRVATRQLAHQPCADFVGRLQHIDYSSCCYPS